MIVMVKHNILFNNKQQGHEELSKKIDNVHASSTTQIIELFAYIREADVQKEEIMAEISNDA